jgi:hypothetical protein
MHVGDAGLDEPMWVYLDFLRGEDWESRFAEHPAGIRKVTEVTLHTPTTLMSEAARQAAADRVLREAASPSYLLEMTFDEGRRGIRHDLRPHLPVILST